jgi:hypothetical protein
METDEDVQHLLELLYRQPEVATYTFHQEGQPMSSRLLAAEKLGFLRVVETQRNWYEHPNFPGDFVRVTRTEFDWQKELLANGIKLLRNELAITEQEKRRREIADTAAAVALASQPNPQSLREHLEELVRRNQGPLAIIGLVLAIAGLALAL